MSHKSCQQRNAADVTPIKDLVLSWFLVTVFCITINKDITQNSTELIQTSLIMCKIYKKVTAVYNKVRTLTSITS